MEYSEAEKQMLREVLPGIAVQLRGALANTWGSGPPGSGAAAGPGHRNGPQRRHSVPELLQDPSGGEQPVRRPHAGGGQAPGHGERGAGGAAGGSVPPGAGPGGADGPAPGVHLPGPGPRHRRQPGAFRAAVLEPGVQRHEIHAPAGPSRWPCGRGRTACCCA